MRVDINIMKQPVDFNRRKICDQLNRAGACDVNNREDVRRFTSAVLEMIWGAI